MLAQTSRRCLVFMNMKVRILTYENLETLNVLSNFCRYPSQTSPNLVLTNLSIFQSPKHVPKFENPSIHLHLDILHTVWFSGELGSDLIFIYVFGVACVKKGTL